MPSINRYVEIHGQRRLRINTCEGEVGLTEEVKSDGRWTQSACINLNRAQAQNLIEQLADQMAKNF
jgi:hypothetical protein